MTDEIKTTPEAPLPVEAPLSAPRAPADIEPGTLTGRRNMTPQKRRDENDTELFAKVKAMSGTQMRMWLRNPENRAKFEAAQARKKK